jgi:type VI secretion system protein
MNQDLFETLTGSFLDGTPIDAVPPEERTIWSIRDNLTRLFTARAGILPHLPGYGLPDITEIYRQMPYGIPKLREAMETAIAEYEPRLKNVRVIYKEPPASPDGTDAMGQKLKKKPFVFEFTITGEAGKAGSVSYSSTLPAQGSPKVSRVVKKE